MSIILYLVLLKSELVGVENIVENHLEAAIPQSDKEELSLALSSAGVGTWILDPLRKMVRWDARCKELFGFAEHDVVEYSQVLSLIHPDDAVRVDEAVVHACSLGSNGRYDVHFRTIGRDNALRWLHCKGQAYFNEEGQPVRFAGIAMDETERMILLSKNTEERNSIEKNQQELMHLFDQSPIAIAIVKKDKLTFSHANKFYGVLVDRDPADIIGKPMLEALPEIKGQGFDKLLQDVLDTGVPFVSREVPANIRRGDQIVTIFVDLVYQPYREFGNDITGVMMIAADITEQKMARQKIENSEQRLRTLIQSAPIAIGLFEGKDLIIQNPNQAFIDVIGRGQHITGKSLRQVMPELESQPFLQILDNVYSSGKMFQAFGAKLLVMRNGVQEEKYFDVTFSPITNEEGKVTAVLDISVEVTEQVLALKKIEENEERFRSLVENTPDVITRWNPDLQLTFGNESFEKLMGRELATLLGKNNLQMGRPAAVSDPFMKALRNVFVTGQPQEHYSNVVADGGDKMFHLRLVPEKDKDGVVVSVISIARDITALKRSEAKFRSLIMEAPFATAVYAGPDLIIDTANEQMINLWGKTPAVVGLKLADALPELEGQPFLGLLKDVFTTGNTFSTSKAPADLVVSGKLQRFWFNFTYKPLRDENGEVYAILNMAVDISDQVNAQRQLEEAEAGLLEAIEIAELGTWSYDVEKDEMTYSSKMQEWYGFDRSTVSYAQIVQRIADEDKERVEKFLGKATDKNNLHALNDLHTIVNPLTGQQRTVHSVGKPAYDETGNIIKIYGTSRDVTLQYQVQRTLEEKVKQRTEELAAANASLQTLVEELRIANEKLAHSNEELSQYAYVASHDLQEPLRKIRLFSNVLVEDEQLSEAGQKVANKIEQSAKRMSVLINDLLEFSMLLKSDELAQLVDLNEIVEAVFTDFELSLQEKGAVVTKQTLPVINAVALQMNQLFYNLLGNALKFTKPGQPPIVQILCSQIETSEAARYITNPSTQARYFHIQVKDEGIGFDPQYADQIFEVFKRLHAGNVYAGSGIGLAVCQRIVIKHKGHLWAESEPGKGSTLHVILPDTQKE